VSAGDDHWNAERQAVEFGVEIAEYDCVVRVPRRVFQRLLPERPTPERCVEAFFVQPTRFEGHRRAEASTAPIDRRWECRDQWTGPALSRRWETVSPARGASQIDPKRPLVAGYGERRGDAGEALLNLLVETIEADRYPMSPRIRLLHRIDPR
jgi:hypothetical protein